MPHAWRVVATALGAGGKGWYRWTAPIFNAEKTRRGSKRPQRGRSATLVLLILCCHGIWIPSMHHVGPCITSGAHPATIGNQPSAAFCFLALSCSTLKSGCRPLRARVQAQAVPAAARTTGARSAARLLFCPGTMGAPGIGPPAPRRVRQISARPAVAWGAGRAWSGAPARVRGRRCRPPRCVTREAPTRPSGRAPRGGPGGLRT